MKLIFCPLCHDVIRLHASEHPRPCLCGRSWGRYRNLSKADIGGAAVLLGISNVSLLKAVGDSTTTSTKLPIKAYVFPRQHEDEPD